VTSSITYPNTSQHQDVAQLKNHVVQLQAKVANLKTKIAQTMEAKKDLGRE
jgi:phage shock protein A